MSDFSLADFANYETDDIKALDSLLPPAGTFLVSVTQAQLGENDQKEGIDPKTNKEYPPLYYAAFKYEVLEATPLDKSLDPESLVGRVLSDRFTFWPSDMAQQIGLLKGRYEKAGIDNTGRLGGLEGGEPGWIDNAVDKVIRLRIKHTNSKGQTYANFDWSEAETAEEAADAA